MTIKTPLKPAHKTSIILENSNRYMETMKIPTKKQHAEFIKVLDEQKKLHSQTIGFFETFNKSLCTEKKRKCRESSDSN